jgi:hypothetical protein
VEWTQICPIGNTSLPLLPIERFFGLDNLWLGQLYDHLKRLFVCELIPCLIDIGALDYDRMGSHIILLGGSFLYEESIGKLVVLEELEGALYIYLNCHLLSLVE